MRLKEGVKQADGLVLVALRECEKEVTLEQNFEQRELEK